MDESIKPKADQAFVNTCEAGHRHVTRVHDRGDGDVDVSHGVVHEVKDGQPMPAGVELVELRKRPDGSFECETLYRHPGPAKVTTDAYRGGWDALWGNRQTGADRELN